MVNTPLKRHHVFLLHLMQYVYLNRYTALTLDAELMPDLTDSDGEEEVPPPKKSRTSVFESEALAKLAQDGPADLQETGGVPRHPDTRRT